MYAYCSNNPVMYKDILGTTRVDSVDTLIEPIGPKIIFELIRITAKDLALLIDLSYIADTGTEEGSVDNLRIEESYKIVTPWVQWGYSYYLNHVNEDTKDLIKGSTTGFQFEWMVHNIAYYSASLLGLDSIMDPARSVDVGNTIYNDSHGPLTVFMTTVYALLFPLNAAIDKSIYNRNQRSGAEN